MNDRQSLVKYKTIRNHLYKILNPNTLSLDIISAMAGDRCMTDDEKNLIQKLQSQHGESIYTHIIFILTHQRYSNEVALSLWKAIKRHKDKLKYKLGRNVGIIIAAADYLSNVRDMLQKPFIISQDKINEIAELAIKDGLTKLFNVSTFYNKLETEITRFERYDSEFSVVMVDIDNFKKFNDTYGHRAGDKVLSEVASYILKSSRDLDICCRYGGEEFAIILPQTDSKYGVFLAERIRGRIEQRYFRESFKVTVSIGIASCPKDATSGFTLVERADEALYYSKENGKNRVSVYNHLNLVSQNETVFRKTRC
ncbi:MAG: GGDEF domain-containing protein [Desulfobacteraceae bacterium]|nr:GGDEF domain-containing protein [Desulfobacteraceae bacterium]